MGTDEDAIGEVEKRRRLNEKQARARRDSSEGSVESKRGLGDLVGANEKLRRSKRELLLKQKEGRKGGKDCPTLSSRQSEARGFMNHKIV